MAKIEDKTSLHSKMRSAVREIAALGDNSVVRRIESMITQELQKGSSEMAVPLCRPEGDFHCRPDRCLVGQTLTLDESMDEFQADDRRRSIFLDPEENIVTSLVDYYSGRLDSVEFRNPEWRFDFEALRQKAVEHLRNRVPVVTINHTAAQDEGEVIFLLRSLADALERRDLWSGEDMGLLAAGCSRTTTTLGTRWTNNGRTLETRYQEVEKCCKKDSCCGNETCSTRTVRDWWQATWNDSGSGNPPPINPPPYQNTPWNNQAPIFNDPGLGTITSDYGYRTDTQGNLDFHPGVDIAAPAGTNVNSLHSGTVKIINNGGTDRGIHITSGNNLYVYWHIAPSAGLQNGQMVNPGDDLGTLVPWPGQPNRPHVHHAHYSPAQQTDANARDPFPPQPLQEA